jgi:hypothetical protein
MTGKIACSTLVRGSKFGYKRDGEMIEIDSRKIAHELARNRIIKGSGVSAPASHLS